METSILSSYSSLDSSTRFYRSDRPFSTLLTLYRKDLGTLGLSMLFYVMTEIERVERRLMAVQHSAVRLDSINAITNASSWMVLRLFYCVCLLTSG